MSQPKKKTSRGRRDRRRYHTGRGVTSVVTGTTCPQTGELVRSHGLPKDFEQSAYYQSRVNKKPTSSKAASAKS